MKLMKPFVGEVVERWGSLPTSAITVVILRRTKKQAKHVQVHYTKLCTEDVSFKKERKKKAVCNKTIGKMF